jgi:predicted nuclease of predicted toxin-antitoxin system
VKVLLDHCVPKRFKRFLLEHDVKTAREMGWAELTNGQLLEAAASAEFDAVLTVDRKLKHEQNVATLPIAVIIIASGDTRLSGLLPFVAAIDRALSELPPRSFVEITHPERIPERGR